MRVHLGHELSFSTAYGKMEVGVKLTEVTVQEVGCKTTGNWFYLSPQGVIDPAVTDDFFRQYLGCFALTLAIIIMLGCIIIIGFLYF